MDDAIAIKLSLFLAILSISVVILSKACLCCSIYFSSNTSDYREKIWVNPNSTDNSRSQLSRQRNHEAALENLKSPEVSMKKVSESHPPIIEIFA